MAKITIELEQAHEHLSRREGRLLRFPDGLERIIALPRRNWLMYDQLAERWVYQGLYENECFEIAHQYGVPGESNFESAITYLIGLAIESGWALLNENVLGKCNDNREASKTRS